MPSLSSFLDEFIRGNPKISSVNSAAAVSWFKKNLFSRNYSFNKLKQELDPTTIKPGSLVAYVYDPKTKDRLPLYDTVPLIIVTSMTNDGWYGVNLHYLPRQIRALLLKEIYNSYDLTKEGRIAGSRMNWSRMVGLFEAIEKNKWLNHSIKRYLASHVRSQVIGIPSEHWSSVVFLPIARFEKGQPY